MTIERVAPRDVDAVPDLIASGELTDAKVGHRAHPRRCAALTLRTSVRSAPLPLEVEGSS